MRRTLFGLLASACLIGGASGQPFTGYPAGATPLTAAFTGADTTTAAATLPAAVGQRTYVCGYSISGAGATAATPVNAVLSGLTTSLQYVYTYIAGATLANQTLQGTFLPCVPSSALNTAIVMTVPGAAGNTNTAISLTGYSAFQ
jgi:hypothetical protein